MPNLPRRSQNGGTAKSGPGGKPISEFKALQNLKSFKGDRKEFREWNEKLLNALAQVKHDYRTAVKNLNRKLEAMDGIIPDDDSDDLLNILNGRLTRLEYQKATPARQQVEDSKGDFSFTDQDLQRLDEDLWYVLNEKLEGAEVLGKLKGLSDGDGITAYQKYSSGTPQSPALPWLRRCLRP